MSDAYGSYRVNPAFDRHPREGKVVGKLLASFSEIEFAVCRNAGHAAQLPDQINKALYRLRATSSRIAAADAIARPVFRSVGLGEEYLTAYAMVGICLRIRNQFAHCNWADLNDSELFFADLQEAADAPEGFELMWRHASLDVLMSQEAYFALTMEWLSFLDIDLG